MDEITAEYSAEALQTQAPLRLRPSVTVACKTDLGRVRENNEDKFEYYLPEEDAVLASRGLVFMVCDGMGGHAAGQIASELTAKTFLDVYLHHPAAEVTTAAHAAVVAANRFVLDVGRAVPSRRNMGTTLSALLLVQDAAYTVQVGDSRVYRLRGDQFEPLTIDHTWVEEAIRKHGMSRELAESSQNRHILVRAIGTEADYEPDIEQHDLQPGDLFVLCSDGLINHVDDDRIADAVRTFGPSEACRRLVASALSGGGSDNCTVMVVRVDRLESV